MKRISIQWGCAVIAMVVCAGVAKGQIITITPPSLPPGEVGVAYPAGQGFLASDTVAGGPFTFASSALPQNGILLTSNGVLIGTPISATPITFSVTATDSNGTNGAGPFTINVIAGPSITPTTLPSGTVGVPYGPQALSGTGGTSPYTLALASAPPPAPGLTFTGGATGSVGGTPTQAGNFNFSVTITDAATGTSTQNFTVQITAPPLVVATTSLPAGEATAPYVGTTLAATGGAPPYTWSVTPPLPPNLVLNPSTGAITGSLSASATTVSGLVFKATDSASTSATSAPLTLTVNAAPTIASATLPSGDINTPYPAQTLTATGGASGGYTWSLSGGAPPGISINPSTGQITGTPTASGTFNFTAQAKDTAGGSGTQSFSITINPAPSISPTSLPAADAGSFSQTLTVTGGTGPYAWSSTGTLPAGVTLTPAPSPSMTATLSGPATAGAYNFTVKVTDSLSSAATQNYTGNINAAPTISPASLPAGEVSIAYSQPLTASGGTGSLTWSLANPNTLPPGLNLNTTTGLISGTPNTAGQFNFGVVVTDTLQVSSSPQQFSITIAPPPGITTAPTLPNGTVGTSYGTVTLAATGGTSPYTWSITTGAPPAGLNFNATPTTATISGTPSASGTTTFTVQVSDAKSVTGTKQFTITIVAGLTIVTAPSLPNGTIGQAYTLTLQAAGGTSPYSWQVATGALPGGLTFDNSGNISGTPTGNGTFIFTVQVTDSNSVTATKQFTLIVASGLNITNAPTLPSGVVGGAYSQTLIAIGGTSPYTWTITGGALPGGLSFNNGAISGTPSTGGSFSFTVTVTDSTSLTASKSFSISIAALLAISTQPALPSGGVGTPYTQPLTAVGGTAPYAWTVSAGSLPGGLTLGPTSGTISGTPTSVGSFSFTVQVTDNNSVSTTKGFTLAIVSALTITTQPTLPGGAVGVGYSQSVVVVGGSAPYTWSITSGSLPAGLTLAPSSGAIGGTPSSAGNFTFTVQVTDSASVSVNKAFSIAVVAGLTITTAPVLPSDSVGVGYTVTLAAAGGSSPYTWAVSAGGLPGGLALDAKSGSIFGTPTASGSFAFTVKVTDNASNTASKQFSIAVAAGLTITTAPVLPNGAIGATYSQTLGAAGGAAPYNWSITQGALPGGLTLDPSTGAIAGTAAASGSFNFTVQVTDSASATATKLFSVTISASLSITTPSGLPNGSIGVLYSLTFAVAGGAGPYQWTTSAGTLPGGFTLDSSTGALSGTPVGAGTFSFTVTVTDSSAHQASQQFSLTIVSGLVISTAPQLPTGFVGSPYSETLNAAGGTPQYRWAVTAGTLPPGLGLSPGGVLSGTPTANGAFKFTVQVTDNTGATASLQLSVNIGSGLTISSPAALPPGTPGQLYTAIQLAAAGGSQCCTWTITSGAIAPGLTLSAGGIISGTPTTAGAFTFTVQATDSSGAKASQVFTISIIPPAPELNVSGLPETAASAQQINFSVALTSGYPLDITGTATLTFAPDAVAPADDPAIQLSTGGRTANFKIAANTKNAVFSVPQIALQTGTVSGTITLTFTLEAGGTQLPSTGLTQTITIARAAPTISAVKIVTSSNSFQVEVTGFSSPRELTEADLTFTPAAGSTLQTTSAIIDLTAVGKQWFESSTSAKFGSQFILVMPFTATQGNISAVASVSVVLKDSTGASPAASATF